MPNTVWNIDASVNTADAKAGAKSVDEAFDSAARSIISDFNRVDSVLAQIETRLNALGQAGTRMGSALSASVSRSVSGDIRERVSGTFGDVRVSQAVRDDAYERKIANQRAMLEIKSQEANRRMNAMFEAEIATKSGRAPGEMYGVRDSGFVSQRIGGSQLEVQRGVVSEAERALQISAEQSAQERSINAFLSEQVQLRRVAAETQSASMAGRQSLPANYDMISQRIAGTYVQPEDASKQEAVAAANAKMNAQLARDIQLKQQATVAYANYKEQFPQLISNLEKQASIQGGRVIPETVRLSTTTDALTGKIVTHASAQTMLDSGMKGHVNTLDRASQGLSRYTSLLTKMAASMIVWEGFRAVTATIQEVIDAQVRLSGEVARFSIITGESIDSAKQSYMELQGVMALQGVAPSQAGESPLRIARFTKNPAEQAELAKVASQMANVLGIDVTDATAKLIAILEQEKRSASDAGAVMDELIAIYRETGSSVDEIVNAMTEAAVIQDKWNTSSLETKGLIAELAQAANESSETVSGALIRVTNEIQGLKGEKFVEVSSMFRGMGIEIQNTTTGEILPALEVLKNISSKFQGLSPDQQAQIYEVLGLEKPQYQQIGRELMSALSDGIVGSLEVMRGAGEKAGQAFAESFQGAVNRLKATREMVAEKGTLGENIVSTVLTGLGPGLGKDATKRFADIQQSAGGGFADAGKSIKDSFLKSIQNLSPDEQAKAILEYEQRVRDATMKELQSVPFFEAVGGLLGGQFLSAQNAQTFGYYDAAYASTAQEVISKAKQRMEELKAAGKLGSEEDGKQSVEQFTKSQLQAIDNWISGLSERKDIVGDLAKSLLAPLQPGIKGRAAEMDAASASKTAAKEGTGSIDTAERKLQDRLRNVQGYLPTDAIDMSKLSVDQFNMALRESEQMFYAILDAQKREMELAGLSKDEIDAKVASMIEEAKLQEILVEKAGKQYEYVRGIAGINLKDILSTDKFKDLQKPDFAFKRLKDFDPSQFGQLQSLTQMYDRFLSNIGSPEKKQNINLLLGEQNVFKTMNGRMTALQMALEDLTKVEKAQLSGTWNMPAGSTALVPISSLDIQRWNKAEGGGLSAEALAALMNATADSGDTVSQSQQLAATRIIEAIRETFTKEGLPMDKVEKAKTPGEAIKAVQETILERRDQIIARKDDLLNLARSLTSGGTRGMVGGEGIAGAGADYVGSRKGISKAAADISDKKSVPNVQVTVASTPIKATFNATLQVMMNGSVVARALVPLLYSMLTKTSASSGQRPQGVQR